MAKQALPRKLEFKFKGFSFTAKTLNKNQKVVQELADKLPIQGYAERWGDEIYFQVDMEAENEEETMDVKIGDIAYWSPGPAIAIFFGKTPTSKDSQPEPASPVGVFARIENPKEVLAKLRSVKHDDRIVLKRG